MCLVYWKTTVHYELLPSSTTTDTGPYYQPQLTTLRQATEKELKKKTTKGTSTRRRLKGWEI